MIEDMQLCGFSTRTQQSYVRSVEGLARYHKPSVWKQHAWVVHSEPVGSGETTLGYLARYVNRVALSNKAILSAFERRVQGARPAYGRGIQQQRGPP